MPHSAPWPDIDWLSPDARVDLTPADGWYAATKPAVDLVLSLALLLFALPVIGFAWLLARAGSAGPGFYVQTRSGENGRNYRIIKVRTMRHNCEVVSGIQWAKTQDDRTTPVGKLLRRTHLDELPQLFNVLRGEMSLVGPRPERPEVIKAKGLADKVPGYLTRLSVRPGVTGLAQLQLPSDSGILSVRHKVVYDLYYITHRTLWLDLRIIAATAFKAAGVGPTWLRRLFLLPSRDAVARAFRQSLVLPPEEQESSGSAFETVDGYATPNPV